MSLDVYLTVPPISPEEVFSANITHNLGKMANEAGVYVHLWRPEELGLTKAGELIVPLQEGLAKLKAKPEHFRQFEPENKWGTYDQFLSWIERYLAACIETPHADIRVSR